MSDEPARDVPEPDELSMPEDPDLDYVPTPLLAPDLRLEGETAAMQTVVVVPSLFRQAAELRGQSRLDER